MKILNHTILLALVVIVVSCGNETDPTQPPAPLVEDTQSPPSGFHNIGEWVRSNDGILEFRIGTNKKTYQTEDEIYVSLELKNISKDTILIEPISHLPFGSTDQLVFTGPKGDVKYIGVYKSTPPPHPKSLLAGASLNMKQKLTSFEDISVPGKYSIRYRYVSSDHYNMPGCWKGEIPSNTVTFKRR